MTNSNWSDFIYYVALSDVSILCLFASGDIHLDDPPSEPDLTKQRGGVIKFFRLGPQNLEIFQKTPLKIHMAPSEILKIFAAFGGIENY